MLPFRFFSQWSSVVLRASLLALIVALSCSDLRAASPKVRKAVEAYLEGDRATPPPAGGILFVGSSSIARWKTLDQDFPDRPIIGRGMGGSTIADCVEFIDRIVLPYRPRQVIFYAGENDIARGRAPALVADDFAQFCRLVHEVLPETRIVFISIKPSPARRKHLSLFNEANAVIANYCTTDERLSFVDVVPHMLDAMGEPRSELFSSDRLHMNTTGYEIWARLVEPELLSLSAVVANR